MPMLLGGKWSGRSIYPAYPNQIPGVDYAVGRTSVNALQIPGNGNGGTTVPPAGVNIGTPPRMIITGNNVTLTDWDLRGWWVDQTTGNATRLTQCILDNSAAPAGVNVAYAVYHTHDMTIDHCSFFGITSPNAGTAFVGPIGSATLPATGDDAELVFEYNYSEQAPQTHVYFAGGTIRYNQMAGVGFVPGAHGNCILMTRNNVVGTIIHDNYLNMLPCPDPGARWSYPIFITAQADHDAMSTPGKGNTLGVDVYNNLTYGGSYAIMAGDARYLPMTGANIHGNYCDLSHANCLGYLYPNYVGATLANNYNAVDGIAFGNPPASITDLTVGILSSTSVQLAFTSDPSATSFEYSYSADGIWDNAGPGAASEQTWATLAGNRIVIGVTAADVKWWRVRALRAGLGMDSGLIAGNESNITLAGQFSLPTINAAAHNAVYASQFKWTGAAAAISVSGGQYRINGGALTGSAGTLATNDIVDVQMNGPAALSSSASMTVTVAGLGKTMTVNSGTAVESLLYFCGPHLSIPAEKALAGDWLTHANNLDTYRPNNLVWTDMTTQYDPALAYYIRWARGGAADDKTDGDGYMTNYVAANPSLWHGVDAHRLSISPAAYYLLNGTHLDWARAMVDNCEWQYEETGGPNTAYNNAAQYWTQRAMGKLFGSVVAGRWVGAQPGGSIGVTPGNYTGGVTQLAADFLSQIMARQDAKGAWPMAYAGQTWAKPWQDTLILNNLILYHKNFAPLNDGLKAVILKGAEWMWVCHSQYSNMGPPTFSTSSGKYTAIYMDKYDAVEGAPDGLNGLPDLAMDYGFAFAYAYFLTGDTTWRDRIRGILKAAVADAWYAGGGKWWTELSLAPMLSYYDQLVLVPPTFPVCSAAPVGSIATGFYTITGDGTWNNTPTATEYEIWHWKKQATAGAIYHRISQTQSTSVAAYSGDLIKGRVRKQNAAGWGAWNDTAWTVAP